MAREQFENDLLGVDFRNIGQKITASFTENAVASSSIRMPSMIGLALRQTSTLLISSARKHARNARLPCLRESSSRPCPMATAVVTKRRFGVLGPADLKLEERTAPPIVELAPTNPKKKRGVLAGSRRPAPSARPPPVAFARVRLRLQGRPRTLTGALHRSLVTTSRMPAHPRYLAKYLTAPGAAALRCFA